VCFLFVLERFKNHTHPHPHTLPFNPPPPPSRSSHSLSGQTVSFTRVTFALTVCCACPQCIDSLSRGLILSPLHQLSSRRGSVWKFQMVCVDQWRFSHVLQ
jgi:hypothetical protein